MLLFAAGLALAFALPGGAGATTVVAPNFVDALVASGLSKPTAMAFAPDGRLFVAQQGGDLRVIREGRLLTQPFLRVTVDAVAERGLLGVAFSPSFAADGYVYVYYTVPGTPAHNRVSRFTAAGDVAADGSEVVILDLGPLSTATNHNGGAMHFGDDGKLYIGVGENNNGNHSQTLGNLLGKMLRINPDGSIPTDNPFFSTATGVNRAIWALGLRNPFTFAFQPGTGRMFINDVGQNTWEEINEGVAGANYGWPQTEGATADPRFRSPVFFYAHGNSDTTGCAVVGGAFYNPSRPTFPAEYSGDYFFADVCSGWIRRIDPANGYVVGLFATGIASPVDLRVGPEGSLYYLERGTGSVRRISYGGFDKAMPVDGASGVPTSPTLAWTHSLDAGGYEYCLDTVDNDSCDTGWIGAGTGSSATVAGLSHSARYHWQVRTAGTLISADGGRWASFTTPAVIADFDANGSEDLLWQQPAGSVAVWLMNGTTFSGNARTVRGDATEWRLITSVDLDADEHPDLVWQHPSGAVAVWLMNGTRFTGHARTVFGGATEWSLVGTGDFNGDGSPDLLWQHPGGSVAAWFMSGTSFTGDARTVYAGTTEWSVVATGDFDGDGKPDLVWQHPDGRVAIWLMDGVDLRDATTVSGRSTEWEVRSAIDLNGDGGPDLLWQHPDGRIAVWLMDGTRFTGDSRSLSSNTEWRLAGRAR